MSWEEHLNPRDELLDAVIAEKYQLLERIGEGGMSVVYKALHLQLDRIVAVKIVQDRHAARDPQSMERFRQEARAASSLTHPNVITVFDYGVASNGMAYLVMDFLDGEGLDSVFRRETLRPRRWVHIFEQVCDALTQAHSKGIIHRDIKPSNIMLVNLPDREDFVKIVDFGIAKLVPGTARGAQQLTQAGEILGSPLYMSPEQCMGQALDIRSDVYSLGCVMYEAFTGTPPIQGENVLAIIYKHIHYTPAEFNASIPEAEIPADLEAVIQRALRKDPAERWPTTSEMRNAITKAARNLPPDADNLDFSPDALQARTTIARQSGLDTTAKIFLERLSFAEANHGKNSPDLIPILAQMGEYYRRQKLHVEAEKTYHRAVRILVSKHGAFSPEVADAVFGLAEFYQSLGRHKEAEPLLVDLVTIKQKAKNKDKCDLPYILQCLGDVYKFTGRYDEAESTYVKSLRAGEKLFGKDDIATVATISRLAQVFYMQARYSEAIGFYKRLVAIYEREYGTIHELVADALVSLSINYQCNNQLPQAEAALSRALITQECIFGSDHPSVASTAVFLADFYCATGNHMNAEALYKRALDIRLKHFGQESLDVATAYECLAAYYHDVFRLDDAEQMYKSAISIKKKTLGAGHPDLALSTRALALIYERTGQHKKAEYYFVAALEAFQETNAQDVVAVLYHSLGEVYFHQDKLPQAREAFERSLAIKEKLKGKSDIVLVDTLDKLGLVLDKLHEPEGSQKLKARAAKIRASKASS
jgi:serine/threonine protein kinase/Tfp pilus assembly protein PilF